MLQYKFLNRRGDAVVIVGRRDVRRDGLHFVSGIGHGHGETGGFEHIQIVLGIAEGHDLIGRDAVELAQAADTLALVDAAGHDFQERRHGKEDVELTGETLLDEGLAGHQVVVLAPAEKLVAVALDAVEFVAADTGLAVRDFFIAADPLIILGRAQDVVDIGLHLPALFPGQVDQFLCRLLRNGLLEEDFLRFQRLDEAAGKEQQRTVAEVQAVAVRPGRLVHASRGDGDDDALIAGCLQGADRPVRHAAVAAQERPIEVDGDHLYRLHQALSPFQSKTTP